MPRKCQVCGKSIMRGHKVSHSKQRSKKIWRPNLQIKRFLVNGVRRKMVLCTKCIKKMKKLKNNA